MCLLNSKSIGLLYKEKEVIHILVIVQSYIWARSEMKDKAEQREKHFMQGPGGKRENKREKVRKYEERERRAGTLKKSDFHSALPFSRPWALWQAVSSTFVPGFLPSCISFLF